MKFFKFLIAFNVILFLYAIQLTIKEADLNNKCLIERGSLLILTCESDSISQIESVQWFLPSSPVSPVIVTDSTQRVSFKSEIIGNKRQVILTVRDVSAEFSGKFYCKSYQYEGSSQRILSSAEITLSLYKSISPIMCNIEQWVQVQTTASLRCELDSEPRALVTWVFKGNQLSQSAKYKLNTWGLDIYNVDFSDAGQYVVTAKTIAPLNSFIRDIIVKVFQLPTITSGPTIIAPITDGVIEWWYSDIQCLGTGNPPPTIHWFRKKYGNVELQVAKPEKYFVNTNPKKGTMRILYPRYPDDNDEYTCQAMLATDAIDNVNFPSSIVSRAINISVTVRPEFTQVEQMNKDVKAGQTVFIQCRVRTTDPVKLIWQRYLGQAYDRGVQVNDSRITVSHYKEPLDPLFQVLKLEIKNARFSDSWNYTCYAVNPGFNYSYNGTIRVWQKPIFANNTPTTVYGWLFNATNLTCLSYGLPHPTKWTWFRYGYAIENDINSTFRILSYDYETSSQSWLQINPDLNNQYWIFNIYYCHANNEMGTSRRELRFNRASVPGPPRVTYISNSASSLAYKLEPSVNDGGMHLMHYEMVYRALQGPTTIYGPVIYQPDETTIIMDGLIHDTNYQVSFYACNGVGRSPDTTVIGNTPSATVPNPVKVISKLMSGYPYGYNLEWIVPLNGGYPLLGYRIIVWPTVINTNYNGNTSRSYLVRHPEFLKVANFFHIYEPVLTNPYESVFRLDDLDAETIYKVSIMAKNTIGLSNSTIHYFATPIGDTLGKPARIRGFQAQLQPFISLYVMIVFIFQLFIYFYC